MTMKKWLILLVGLVLFVPSVHASKADLDVFPPKTSACRLGVASYEVKVKNLGPVEDTFDITANSGCKCITITPQEVTLEKGEEKSVYLWYNPETDVEPGTYDFNVYATSQTSGERYSHTATVEVLGCRDLDLNVVQERKTSCRNQTADFQFEVVNTGREKEKVKLTSTYGSISQSQVTLNPGESRTLSLRASNGKVESKDIEIKAESLSSYAKSSKLVTLTTEKCYDSDLSVSPAEKEVCAGLTDSWTITVRNKGTKSDTFTLESEMGGFSDATFELQPGQVKQTQFHFKPSSVRNYSLTLRAVSNVVRSEEVRVIGRDCKSVSVVTVPTVNKACEDEMAQYNVRVENTGQVKDSYSIVSNIGVMSQNRLVLEPGESKALGLNVRADAVETGRHRVKVRARSQTSDAEDYSEVELDAMNCYDLNLSMSTDEIVCNGINATLFTLDLKNTGEQVNMYSVDLEGPEWLSYKPKNLQVESGETGQVYIYASAPYNVSGEFVINATVEDQSGTVTKEKSFDLKVKRMAKEDELPDELPGDMTGRAILVNLYNDIKQALEQASIPVELFLSVVAGVILVSIIVLFETTR